MKWIGKKEACWHRHSFSLFLGHHVWHSTLPFLPCWNETSESVSQNELSFRTGPPAVLYWAFLWFSPVCSYTVSSLGISTTFILRFSVHTLYLLLYVTTAHHFLFLKHSNFPPYSRPLFFFVTVFFFFKENHKHLHIHMCKNSTPFHKTINSPVLLSQNLHFRDGFILLFHVTDWQVQLFLCKWLLCWVV